MSRQLLIQQQGSWLVFDNDRVSRSDTRPRPQRSALAIADFEGGVSSVVSLEGSPAHAVALIEKRLRADGLIDSESKILIHKTRTVGAGYQTLFTAAPLDLWQQTYAWAEAQPDHCLLIPITSLLWSKLKAGDVLIYHSGRQITALALLKHTMIYRSSLAYSDDAGDLAMTSGALAEQIANDLEGDERQLEPQRAHWCSVLVPAPPAGEPWLDDNLREVFSARSGMAVDAVPTETVSDEHGTQYRSGIGWLAKSASPTIAVNPTASRLAYMAEWALPLASAASIVFAIALGSIGARWTLSASEANDQAATIGESVSASDARIGALAKDQAIPAEFPQTYTFIEKVNNLQQGIDPIAGLSKVRDAAYGQVRVLRLRMETPQVNAAPGQSFAALERPTLRVDGAVDPAQGGGMQVPTFIERLRQAGYDPIPLDPQGGNVGTSNLFSYLLKEPVANAGATP